MQKINQNHKESIFKNIHPLKDYKRSVIPESSGIYIFFNKSRTPVYVGKAINLRQRVGSYFSNKLAPKTYSMVEASEYLSLIEVTSEIEALLLEANLIKSYKPKYNISLKDDKHPIYIAVTKEEFPRVITARKADFETTKFKHVYGPFPAATKAKDVLKIIRRVFPYSQHKIGNRACIYKQMGLCNPCPNIVSQQKNSNEKKAQKKIYSENIRLISLLLSGRIKFVRRALEKNMKRYSKLEMYEEAGVIKDKIEKFDYITQSKTPTGDFLEDPNLIEDIREREIRSLKKLIYKNTSINLNPARIECFDVAHIAGSSPTASMVTFVGATPDKRFYRHFKIRQIKGNSDTDSLREVARRRKGHLEDWGMPDLIIVDGGKGQVRVFAEELDGTGITICGIAKSNERLIFPTWFDGKLQFKEFIIPKGPALNLAQRLRNEAHRFARRYHHVLVKRELLKN